MANVEERLITGLSHVPFPIADGSRRAGPAQSAVASRNVVLDGDQISVS